MKFIVWINNGKFGITNDQEEINLKVFNNPNFKVSYFDSLKEAYEYIKDNVNKLEKETKHLIKKESYDKMIYINEMFINNQLIVKIRDKNFNDLSKYINDDYLKDIFIINKYKELIFDEEINIEFARLVIYVISLELCKTLNYDLIIFDNLPSFELLPKAGDIYKKLLVYALELRDESKDLFSIRIINEKDEMEIYLN